MPPAVEFWLCPIGDIIPNAAVDEFVRLCGDPTGEPNVIGSI
jgi:hypothetical protein